MAAAKEVRRREYVSAANRKSYTSKDSTTPFLRNSIQQHEDLVSICKAMTSTFYKISGYTHLLAQN
jgi:hypothetical protein